MRGWRHRGTARRAGNAGITMARHNGGRCAFVHQKSASREKERRNAWLSGKSGTATTVSRGVSRLSSSRRAVRGGHDVIWHHQTFHRGIWRVNLRGINIQPVCMALSSSRVSLRINIVYTGAGVCVSGRLGAAFAAPNRRLPKCCCGSGCAGRAGRRSGSEKLMGLSVARRLSWLRRDVAGLYRTRDCTRRKSSGRALMKIIITFAFFAAAAYINALQSFLRMDNSHIRSTPFLHRRTYSGAWHHGQRIKTA